MEPGLVWVFVNKSEWHLPHHLAPKIPWYHLRAATEAIRAADASWVQERRFSLAYLRAAWAKPLIARAPSGDHFEMAAFDGPAHDDR